MNQAFEVDVTISEAGFTTIQIRDTTGRHPTMRLFERPEVERVIWLGSGDCALPLCQEQVWEALPYLLTFLDTGRLVKR
jgi:hypothetical protein